MPQDKFVLEAIQEKLEREKHNNLKQLLAEGYKATAKEELALTKEFENINNRSASIWFMRE